MAPGRKRIQSFDGARAIAVFIVLMRHLNHLLDPYFGNFTLRMIFRGEWANMFFFTLSGFLVAFSNAGKKDLPAVGAFCRKRIGKIYPLWLATVVFFGALSFAELYLRGQLSKDALSLLAGKLAADIFLVRSWLPGNPYIFDLNGPGWFLSAMVLMWILTVPILKCTRRLNGRQCSMLLVGVLLFQIAWDWLYLNNTTVARYATGIWRMYPVTAYVAGMIAGSECFGRVCPLSADTPWRTTGFLILGVLIGYYVTFELAFLEQAFMICYILYFIRLLSQESHPLCRFLSEKHLVSFGGISMEILLLHVPVMRFIQFFGFIHSGAIEFAVVIMLTWIAALSWKYILKRISALCR